MWIFCSLLFVCVTMIIISRYYKKIIPEIKLISTELVLFPFRLKLFYFPIHMYMFLVLKLQTLQKNTQGSQEEEHCQATLFLQFGLFLVDLSCISFFVIIYQFS